MHTIASVNSADEDALASLDTKLQVARDFVTGVARRFKTGLFLYGREGVGKSYATLRHLESLNEPHQLHASRLTAKGLFLELKKAPEATHVLLDMQRIKKDADVQGVLRCALWEQAGPDRVLTWTTATGGPETFVWRGGLILISNRPLADFPELQGLASQIEVYGLDVSDSELTALMRKVASAGYQQQGKQVIGPDTCLEVTEHLLNECRIVGCRLDLRLQQKSFKTYLQCELDWAVSHWRDLVAASVREAVHFLREPSNTAPREDRQKHRRNVLRSIMNRTDDVKEQQRLYTEETGCSRADFFRKKDQIMRGDFDEDDAA
jgi:hypothetical protein